MQRGQKFFNGLTAKKESFEKNNVRGRNTGFVERRNHLIIHRYYFYAKVCRLTFSETISKLSNEFFLSERTILDLIQRYSEDVKKVFTEKPSNSTLSRKFVFFNWKINVK